MKLKLRLIGCYVAVSERTDRTFEIIGNPLYMMSAKGAFQRFARPLDGALCTMFQVICDGKIKIYYYGKNAL